MTPQEQQAQQFRCAAYILENNSPWEFQLTSGEWKTTDQHILRIITSGLTIRIKPTPTLIPLEAADIPPGSVFKKAYDSAIYTANCIAEGKIYLADTICFTATYISMVDDWLINRSIPLLGKWDPTAWEPCSKPSQNPG